MQIYWNLIQNDEFNLKWESYEKFRKFNLKFVYNLLKFQISSKDFNSEGPLNF